VWKGKSPHNVSVTKGPQKFRSQVQVSGTFSKRLTKAGRYQIVCTIHPGMEQTITVR
jgi:plastocyanin